MIHVDKSLLPGILKLRSCPDWDNGIGDIDTFIECLDTAIATDSPFIMVYYTGAPEDPKAFPPLTVLMKIVGQLLMIRDKIKDGIMCNILCVQDEEDIPNIDLVLKYYTPANETHIARSKSEVMAIINEYRTEQ
jgi:hypothetical protein